MHCAMPPLGKAYGPGFSRSRVIIASRPEHFEEQKQVAAHRLKPGLHTLRQLAIRSFWLRDKGKFSLGVQGQDLLCYRP